MLACALNISTRIKLCRLCIGKLKTFSIISINVGRFFMQCIHYFQYNQYSASHIFADGPIRISASLPPEVIAFLREPDFGADKDDKDSGGNDNEKLVSVMIYVIFRYYFLICIGGGKNDNVSLRIRRPVYDIYTVHHNFPKVLWFPMIRLHVL